MYLVDVYELKPGNQIHYPLDSKLPWQRTRLGEISGGFGPRVDWGLTSQMYRNWVEALCGNPPRWDGVLNKVGYFNGFDMASSTASFLYLHDYMMELIVVRISELQTAMAIGDVVITQR